MERYEHGLRARRAAQPRSTGDNCLTYPLFCMAMSARMKLDKCEILMREIADLNLEQPVPLELRMAVKECLREIGKEDALCL